MLRRKKGTIVDLLDGGEYWKWWANGKVCIFGTEGIPDEDIEKTAEIIRGVIKIFNFPLQILNGNKSDAEGFLLIGKILQHSTEKNVIDWSKFEAEVDKYREKKLLTDGLEILVDPKNYKIKSIRGNEQPIYGLTMAEGLTIVRTFNKTLYHSFPIFENAVRHEFGHMLGIRDHHEDCAMIYTCTIEKFCKKCLEAVKEDIWEL